MTRARLSLAEESDETGGGAPHQGSSGRGRSRIPQSEWPRIVARQQRGDSKSAIARDYNCTPAAIAYILKKAQQAGVQPGDAAAPSDGRDGADGVPVRADEGAERPTSDTGTGSSGRATTSASPASSRMTLKRSAESERGASTDTAQAPHQPAKPDAASTAAAASQAPLAQASGKDAGGASRSGGNAHSPAGESGGGQATAGSNRSGDLDDLQQRLAETARQLDATYQTWKNSHSEDSVSDLRASVHEMRKVLARFEIEIAASRQHEQAVEPFRYPGERARWQNVEASESGRGSSRRGKG